MREWFFDYFSCYGSTLSVIVGVSFILFLICFIFCFSTIIVGGIFFICLFYRDGRDGILRAVLHIFTKKFWFSDILTFVNDIKKHPFRECIMLIKRIMFLFYVISVIYIYASFCFDDLLFIKVLEVLLYGSEDFTLATSLVSAIAYMLIYGFYGVITFIQWINDLLSE